MVDNVESLNEIADVVNEVMEEIRDEREQFWNGLTKDEQLKCFCAVVERIVKSESEGHSYRGVLYDVFGFGMESYTQAQMSGFIELHNWKK